MFEKIQPAPADPILGISETFAADPNPDKINLSVGVYMDENGRTIVLPSVREAETRILAAEKSKGYKPISGAPEYAAVTQDLLFGEGDEAVAAGRVRTAHTPGGTGALRVVADYVAANHPGAAVHVSTPTWPNHNQIFEAPGLKVHSYPYFDAAANGLDFDAMIAAVAKIPAGDLLLLHGCCHNPSGVDLSPAQWEKVAALTAEKGIIPLLDFAYQGFAAGVREDAACLSTLLTHHREMFICSSFSKNFGLYNERTGALTILASDADTATAVMSRVRLAIRSNYSNPPAHGGNIVTTILTDAALRQQWNGEVDAMRERIKGMRRGLADGLASRGVRGDLSFIARQNGMFSFSGLTPSQVDRLRDEHSVYAVRNGRINVAAITPGNLDRLCDAIAAVAK